jgi:hypothetical protein
MKKILLISFLVMVLFVSNTYAKSKMVVVNSSSSIPKTGMTIDASYDAELDGLVKGYKIINVAIKNDSLDIVRLDPELDKWWVVDRKGKKKLAVVDLRKKDPDIWEKLPERLKKLLGYPLMLPTGGTINIDLLFPDSANLNSFRAIVFGSAYFRQTYKIVIYND